MSAYTDAAAGLISERNRLDAAIRDLTDNAAGLVSAGNAEPSAAA
jgi:hypothetical protein